MPYKIVNWKKHQARSERSSNPWVKLHRTILTSADFFAIPKARRWEWPLLLLFANHSTGIIEDSDEEIAFMLRYKDGESWDCKPFIGSLLQEVDTSGIPVATSGNHRYTTGALEERREEEIRGEKKRVYTRIFDEFWKLSPRTGNKKRAYTHWVKMSSEDRILATTAIVKQAEWRQAMKISDPKWLEPQWKHMEYWLRDDQWMDELQFPKVITRTSNIPGGTGFE